MLSERPDQNGWSVSQNTVGTRSGLDHRVQSSKPRFRVTLPPLYSKPRINVPSFPWSCTISPKPFHGLYLPLLAPNPRNLPRLLFVPSDWNRDKNRQTGQRSCRQHCTSLLGLYVYAYLCAHVFGYMCACMNTDLGGAREQERARSHLPHSTDGED